MNVFLFPGQGSQSVGMGTDLLRQDGSTSAWIRLASDATGADLSRILSRGPETELARPDHLQPLLVCVSLGYLHAAHQHGLHPDLLLGHSLGEITALAAAGIISTEDAVRTAARRGALMAEVARDLNGGLLAVTSPQREAVLALLDPSGIAPGVVLANDNSPEQLVLSGPRPDLEQLARAIQAAGMGQSRLLPVAGPWHNPSMHPAQVRFSHWLQTIPFHPPQVPVWFNASGQAETEPARIRTLIAANLSSPVPWRLLMDQLRSVTPRALFEIGPGRVLSGLARANHFGPETVVQPLGSLRVIQSGALNLRTT